MPKFERITDLDRVAVQGYGDFTIVDEDYGFSVRPGKKRQRRALLVEWAAQYMAFLSIFGTFGIVAGVNGLSGTRLDVFEIGIFMCGVALAAFFFWVSLRGTAQELQVDQHRHQFRTAFRNYRGAVRIIEIHDFSTIESAFVHKLSQRSRTGSLSVRTLGDPDGVVLLSGHAKSLSNLHLVLARLLRSKTRPVASKSRAIFNRPAALVAE